MARTRRTSARAVALSAVVALALAACGADEPTVDVDAPAPSEEQPDTGSESEEEPTEEPTDAPTDEPSEEPTVDASDEPVSGPTPDPTQVADACADHAGREGDAFIEVVAPVDEQQVADEVDLVGCSNVYEANVQWSLYDGDGVELDSGFTTAECGTGCVGAFEETISLEAAEGEPFAELHVYAEDASGAGNRLYETAIPLVIG